MSKWKTTGEVVYAFIDSQNLHLGVGNNVYINKKKIYSGWKLDFRKFFKYLQEEYNVERAFVFIGYVEGNEDIYDNLTSFGYDIVFRPTLEYEDKDDEKVTKGNVDTDLVLHAAGVEYDNYAHAIVVSGDGDFYGLYEFLESKGKLKKILIPNKHRYSSLLEKFEDYIDFVSTKKDKLRYKP